MKVDTPTRADTALPPPSNGQSRPDALGAKTSSPMDVWNPVLNGLQSWVRSFGAANVSLHRELFGFVERRLQKDAAFPQRLSTCKAPDEAWKVYIDFLQTAAEDYQKEVLQLARLGGTFTEDSTANLRTVIGTPPVVLSPRS